MRTRMQGSNPGPPAWLPWGLLALAWAALIAVWASTPLWAPGSLTAATARLVMGG